MGLGLGLVAPGAKLRTRGEGDKGVEHAEGVQTCVPKARVNAVEKPTSSTAKQSVRGASCLLARARVLSRASKRGTPARKCSAWLGLG